MRRLPVYLLLDTSGSMSGEPIVSVESGVQMVQSALRRDPYALEQAFISVITFNSSAQQIIPLTEAASFQAPKLTASGATAMGEALELAANCASRELVKNTAAQKGDWRPIAFILTDGMPTDDLQRGLTAFRTVNWSMVVACAAGSGADTAVLQQIAGENVLVIETVNSESIMAFFKFVSASIVSTSKSVDGGVELSSLNNLPKPPPEICLAKL